MIDKNAFLKDIDSLFSGNYTVTNGRTVPNVDELAFAKEGREMELAILFIDIKESTKIVDSFRRVTAAKMYKSFLWGVAKIARNNDGELRSFNGDGVLVVFSGDAKCTNAAKAALQMNWFASKVIKPKVEEYLRRNNSPIDLKFECGIGIDMGKILIVRGGIRGENNNDLVWVGNATNIAVKLAERAADHGFPIHISKDVYDKMHKKSKYKNADGITNMWEKVIWTHKDGSQQYIYRSNWTWSI